MDEEAKSQKARLEWIKENPSLLAKALLLDPYPSIVLLRTGFSQGVALVPKTDYATSKGIIRKRWDRWIPELWISGQPGDCETFS